jgi:hypothetical protein
MSNEMYNVLARVTDGLYEGIAIGGDAYPGSTLSDHVLRFNNIPQVRCPCKDHNAIPMLVQQRFIQFCEINSLCQQSELLGQDSWPPCPHRETF